MTFRINRRSLLAAAAATAFVPKAFAQQRSPDVITYATGTDAVVLDPIAITDRPSARVSMHIHETLAIQKDGKFLPLLAKEWSTSDDGLTWTMNLREGVTFHDGSAFDAEAVKWNFDRFLSPDANSPRRSLGAVIESVDVAGPYVVTFRTKQPFAPFLSVVASYNLGIVSPTAGKGAPAGLARNPVGTGPFKLASWSPNNSIVMERNDSYWGEAALPREVRIMVVPEDSARLLQLLSGQVDVIANVPVPLVPQISKSPAVSLIEQDSIRTIYVGLNMSKGPFADLRVRQALAHSIDVEGITSTLLKGFATPATSLEAPGIYGAATDLPRWSHDPEKAKALLAEAGVGQPVRASFYTPTGRYNGDRQVAEAIQAQALASGFDLQINAPEYGAFLEATEGLKADMFLAGKGTTTADVDSTLRLVVKTGGTVNNSGFSDPELDRMIDEQAFLLDTDTRLAELRAIQQKFHGACVTVPLYYERQIFGRLANVEGVELGRDEHISFLKARRV